MMKETNIQLQVTSTIAGDDGETVGKVKDLYLAMSYQSLLVNFCNTKISEFFGIAKSRTTFCCSGT